MTTPMARGLADEDRDFLQKNFARYGEAWKPGFDMLERSFIVQVQKKWSTFLFTLTTRDVFKITYVLKVGRKHGSLQSDPPKLPQAPEFGPDELALVDQVLKNSKELWLLEPLNSECQWIQLDTGLAGLRGERSLTTRRIGNQALLFFKGAEFDWGLFCVCIDLTQQALVDIAWWELPPSPGMWLPPDEVARIDQYLRANGDFGVYGNVTSGLRDLARYFQLQIRSATTSYHFSVTPRDGHGHFLHFSMDKTTGKIDGCAAGHLVRPTTVRVGRSTQHD
jgi:hypothetical protein